MRTAAIGITLLVLAAAPALPTASTAHAASIRCDMGRDIHWSDRYEPGEARFAITSEDGDVMLLLTDRDVAFQLSDQSLRHARRKLREAEREHEDNWLASAIVGAVTGTVRELLDHSCTCHVRDIRDVSYVGGRLVFTGRDGRTIFGEEDSDDDGMRAFSERDARRFVQEFRKVKAGR